MRGQRVAALLLVVGLVGAVPVTAQVVDENQRLAKLAAEAESAEQHMRVAQQYRERADLLDSQAKRLERKARQLERSWYPHEYKAAPVQRAGYDERRQAATARRDAREARVLAYRHGQIATDLRNAP